MSVVEHGGSDVPGFNKLKRKNSLNIDVAD